ncbi:MAG: hypothetical protein ABI723_02780 [Bacteroidia bacterium]
MEQPKKMLSKITETSSEIIISTPNRKSWILIFAFAVITLQFTNGIIQVFLTDKQIEGWFIIVILAISIPVIYFALKGLLWQLKGINQIKINSSELTYSKLSPLRTKIKTCNLTDIKSIEIKDESVSTGPLAMLQLLSITDKIKINMSYGYETITIISGIDITESKVLKNKIENYIKTS